MEIREHLRILKRRAWIPLLLVLVTGVTTAIFVVISKPTYTATATVLAKSSSASSPTGLSFQEVATSNSLLLRVRKELNLGETVDALSNRLTVAAGKSNIYQVSFTDADADRSVTIANAIATDSADLYQRLGGGTGTSVVTGLAPDQTAFRDQYLAATKALLAFEAQYSAAQLAKDRDLQAQQAQLTLDQQAAQTAYLDFQAAATQARVAEVTQGLTYQAGVVDQAAAKPDTLPRLLKVGYAIALALVVGIGLVFVVEYFDNSIREPDQVEQLIGAPVVAIIPRGTARTLRPARGST
jgi:capsular polysaccharide biosynthesis protein